MDERRKERMKVLTRNLEVCDLLDMRNPQSGAEFAPQIYQHLFREEERLRYPSSFLDNQKEIDRKKRSYLVDYLIEVHYKFKLQPETLYVTVGLLDRYLAAQPDVPKAHLQLLGISALHIAAKYEEIYPPALDKLVKVTQSNITLPEVVAMELRILTALDFDLVWPSALRFLERFVRVLQLNEQHFFLAQYFCEYALLDRTLMLLKPSNIAAIALYSAAKILRQDKLQGFWNATIAKNAGYKEEALQLTSKEMLRYVHNYHQRREEATICSLVKKYSQDRYLSIVQIVDDYFDRRN